MSSTEMKSYLSLIPISAKVRRRQNRMTILCIVIAVFLVSAIFSVADMMLRTQMNRAAGKDGSWHLQIAGITQSQAGTAGTAAGRGVRRCRSGVQ